MKRFLALVMLFAAACGQTEECKKLDELLKENERIAAGVKARASLRDRVLAKAERAENATKKSMTELGLDLGEDQLRAQLEARVKAETGVSFERSTRVVNDQEGATGETETLFVITVADKNEARGLETVRRMLASPPLLRVVTIVREAGKGWRLELARPEIDQVPIKVEPTKPPQRKNPEEIKGQFGFCGAAQKRQRLAEIETEIAADEEKSSEVTTLLPASASWEGLGRRIDLVREVETEARRLINVVLDAAKKAKVSVKAIGVEKELVMAEIVGGTKERARLQQFLDPDTLAQMQLPETEVTPGVARFGLPNRVAKERRRPDQGGNAPPAPPGDHP